MLSQFVFALKMRIKQGFFPFGPREMFRSVVLCSVLLFHFVIFVSFSFSFNEESGFVAGRRWAQEVAQAGRDGGR